MKEVDWAIIGLYLAAVIAIGRYFARRQHDTSDFFLGGGKIPWFAVALSVVATLASTVGYLSAPGEVIQHGIGMLVAQLAIPAAIVVIVFVIVPFYRKANVTTAFELIGKRYGRSTRWLSVIIWAYMQVAFLGLVLLLASRIVAAMIGVPEEHRALGVFAIILVIGIASVLYTSSGGMQSVVWTDALQFVILLMGAIVAVAVVSSQTGTGVTDWWQEVSGRTHELPPWISADLATRHTILGVLFFGFIVNIAYAASEQTIVQRYGATRRAVTMMLANYVAGIFVTLLQIALGAALLVFYIRTAGALPEGVESVTDPKFADDAFPYFIEHYLPAGLTGLVIAALLGAAQSTLDSGINSMSAVYSKDVLPLLNRATEAGHELSSARWVTRISGVCVVFMAIVADNLPASNNIVDIAQKVVHLGLGPMGALFLGMMLFRYVGTIAANIALLLGFVSAIFFAFNAAILGNDTTMISPLLIIPASWFITFVGMIVFGLIIRSDPEKAAIP